MTRTERIERQEQASRLADERAKLLRQVLAARERNLQAMAAEAQQKVAELEQQVEDERQALALYRKAANR
jgi:hypothetical protein